MQPSVGEALGSILARLVADGEQFRSAHPSPQGSGGWLLTVLSMVALLAAGGIAARMAQRLIRRSVPELTVLCNQSAAFYARWPEDRLAAAPRDELRAEAARCRRIVEVLEGRPAASNVDASTLSGSVAGLRTWITLLGKRIENVADAPAGPSYA